MVVSFLLVKQVKTKPLLRFQRLYVKSCLQLKCVAPVSAICVERTAWTIGCHLIYLTWCLKNRAVVHTASKTLAWRWSLNFEELTTVIGQSSESLHIYEKYYISNAW